MCRFLGAAAFFFFFFFYFTRQTPQNKTPNQYPNQYLIPGRRWSVVPDSVSEQVGSSHRRGSSKLWAMSGPRQSKAPSHGTVFQILSPPSKMGGIRRPSTEINLEDKTEKHRRPTQHKIQRPSLLTNCHWIWSDLYHCPSLLLQKYHAPVFRK